MRILLIDDEELILEFLQVCLEDGIPDAEITVYPTLELGRPGPDFDWASYDLLLLDYNLGNDENGIEWLETFGKLPGFPTTVLITAVDKPRVVGRAIASGADGYLNKAALTPERLLETVRDVMQGPLAQADAGQPPAVSAESSGGATTTTALDEIGDAASYRFGRCIGQGAMSRVYLAERSTDGQTVVIKILDRSLAADDQYLQRFRLEGQLVSAIDSPYVVKVYDHGITNSYDYIVMEFFGRGDLKQQIDHGIAPDQALAYLHDIACGLDVIHAASIVHRDLKPANIMFRADGSLALADFGIAKPLNADLGLTEAGAILGSLHYLSPEQARGDNGDTRSDIYTAGIIFYEMLTGKRPYMGRSASAMLMHHMHGEVPELHGRHKAYQPLLDKMMCKDVDGRFQSARELLDAIAGYHDL